MKRIHTITGMLLIASFMLLASCKKEKTPDEEENPSTGTPMGALYFHMHTYVDNTEVDNYNTVYTTDDGRKISMTMAQLYLSHIQLVKLDGSTVEVTGKKVLKVQGIDAFMISEVPVGNYKSVKFSVGFDATDNTENPLTPADSAILNKPQMWLSAAAQPDGYVFMNAQGTIDTTAGATGTVGQMQPFSFRIGTNAHYKVVTMPDQNFTITEGAAHYVHMAIDYYKLFNGLPLNQSANLNVSTTADNALPIGTTIANKIPSMFRYE